MMMRIDNGWSVDPVDRYDPLFRTPTNPPAPWFKDLQAIMSQNDLRRQIHAGNVNTADALRTIVRQYMRDRDLRLGGFFGWRTVNITRHRFQLYLRWCDQNNEFVQ
jgi:hypothetical protein